MAILWKVKRILQITVLLLLPLITYYVSGNRAVPESQEQPVNPKMLIISLYPASFVIDCLTLSFLVSSLSQTEKEKKAIFFLF